MLTYRVRPSYVPGIARGHPWAPNVVHAIGAEEFFGTTVREIAKGREHGTAGSGITAGATEFGKGFVFDGTSNATITWTADNHGTLCPNAYTLLLLMRTTDTSADWWATGEGNRMLVRYSSAKWNVYSNLALEASATITLADEMQAYALTHVSATTTVRMWLDGTELSVTGATSVVYATGTAGIKLGQTTASARPHAAKIAQYVLLDRALDDNEIRQWSADPFALYRPPKTSVWMKASAVGGGGGAADPEDGLVRGKLIRGGLLLGGRMVG